VISDIGPPDIGLKGKKIYRAFRYRTKNFSDIRYPTLNFRKKLPFLKGAFANTMFERTKRAPPLILWLIKCKYQNKCKYYEKRPPHAGTKLSLDNASETITERSCSETLPF
jgi:hypothetical protein